jgi:putative membrane protein
MKRLRWLVAVSAVFACVGLASVATADERKGGDTKGQKDQKDSGDKEFVQKASAAGLAEVNLSNLAIRFSTTPEVQQFARRMLTDHTQVNQQLLALANQKQFDVARSMDDKHQDLEKKLAKMQGKDFDHAFMEAMVKDHEEAVKLFEHEAKEGKDQALKTMASQTLPALKMHLQMAQELCKRSKGASER